MLTLPIANLDTDRCERIDGQLIQRPMSGDIHSDIQENVRRLLAEQAREMGMKARSEWSITQPETAGQAEPNYLTPDVLVARSPYRRTKAGHLIPPAVLAVEIVSPQQDGLFDKAQVLSTWGVEHVWIINPQTIECFQYDGGNQFLKVTTELRAGPLMVILSDVFRID